MPELPDSEQDLKPKPPLQGMSAVLQVVILVMLALAGALLSGVIAYALLGMLSGINVAEQFSDADALLDYPAAALFIQIFTSAGIFLGSSFVFSKLRTGSWSAYLGMDNKPKAGALLLTILIMAMAAVFIDHLVQFNTYLVDHVLPFGDAIIESIRNAQDANAEMTDSMLSLKGIQGLAGIVLAFVLLPAFGEELFFRGALMPTLQKGFKSKHLAVWLTAFAFSLIHLQGYNFLAILFLGAVLGYLYLWSGNIWYPILAHFFNNGVTVLIMLLYKNDVIATNPEEVSLPIWVALAATVLFAGTMYLFRTYVRKEKQFAELDEGMGENI